MESKFITLHEFIPLVEQYLNQGKEVTLTVKGNSMRPLWHHNRDKVVLGITKEVKVGDVVLAKVEQGIYVIHRIIRKEGENLVLKGDGNSLGVETCKVADVRGKVVSFYLGKKQRKYTTKGLFWKIYSGIWKDIPIMRRLILAIDRRIFKRSDKKYLQNN